MNYKDFRPIMLGVLESRSPSIVIASGRAYMLVAEACLSDGECRSQVLASSAVTSDSWTTTALRLPVEEAIQPVGLAAFRSKVWVIGTGASAVLSVSSNGGRSFANLPSTGLAGLACDATATSPSVLWAFCATGSLGYAARSTDGGREFALMPGWNHGYKGDASNAGNLIPLSNNEAVFRSGGPYLYLTRDGGREFSSIWSHNDWNHVYSIAFADTTSWVVLGVSEGPGGNNPLWRTTNSGRTWQPVKAPSVTVPAQRLFKLGPPYRVSVTVSAKTFPLSIYPDAPVYGASDDWSGCPAILGIVASVRPQPELVARLLDQLGRDKLSALKASDPSYWPIILEGNWDRFQDVSPGRLLIMTAAQSGYVSLLGRCSRTTVRDTWVAKTCPGPSSKPASETCSRDPALAGQVFLIDRHGHWLVVFTYP